MGKHAYLIMAHGSIHQLCRLIKAIDDKRNDIYLHMDAKCKDDMTALQNIPLNGKLLLTERCNVNWGGQVK